MVEGGLRVKYKITRLRECDLIFITCYLVDVKDLVQYLSLATARSLVAPCHDLLV